MLLFQPCLGDGGRRMPMSNIGSSSRGGRTQGMSGSPVKGIVNFLVKNPFKKYNCLSENMFPYNFFL